MKKCNSTALKSRFSAKNLTITIIVRFLTVNPEVSKRDRQFRCLEALLWCLRHTSTARETAHITVDHFMTSIPPKNSLIVRFFGIILRTLSTRAFFRKFSDRSSRRTPLPGPRHPEHKKCSSEALKKFAKTPTDSYRKIFHTFCYPDCSNRKKS